MIFLSLCIRNTICTNTPTCRIRTISQKTAFHHAKGGILACKRWPFSLQKATFCKTVYWGGAKPMEQTLLSAKACDSLHRRYLDDAN